MFSSIALIAKSLNVVRSSCELCNTLNEADRLATSEKINAIVHALSIFSQTASVSADGFQASLETKEWLKSAELLTGYANMISELCSLEAKFVRANQELTVTRRFEVFMKHVARIYRTNSELTALEQEKFLRMSDEELSKQRVPVYVLDGEGIPHQVGEKVLSRDDCKTILKDARDMSEASLFFEIVASVKGASIAFELFQSFCEYTSAARSRFYELRQREFADLPEREAIPIELEDDPVLSQYICPITQTVIRHPVIDPVTHTLYERDAILGWIQINPTSPLTRIALSADDLLEVPEIQQIIDDRLETLQRQIDII